jgi:hypothetical protein
MAFSSEVETGSREENASKQEFKAFSVWIKSEPNRLWTTGYFRFLAKSVRTARLVARLFHL